MVTLATFGIERFLLETAGRSLGDAPAFVMGGVVIAVCASAFYLSTRGHSIDSAILIALGPVAGLFVYLLGYHLVFPPSTDSPTWLIFLAFAGGFVAFGIVAFLLGQLRHSFMSPR
ncbi:hypothetical protein [Haloferax sp. DFSO60]|uniref:hypothetical protein n=1 Tax=Haloferax sp. DFSO60 TaxID=3388652 RepID=UPI00397DA1E3